MPELFSCGGDDALFLGRRPERLLEFDHPRRLASNAFPPHKFAYARTALKYGLLASGFRHGDFLLVPDLVCESLLEPLAKLGIRVGYYPVSTTLDPEWSRLETLLTPQTKGLLVVHYFGQPQSIPDCLGFCRRKGLVLIEDNAHGYGGTVDGQLLGTFGEVGITAPRKSFPLNNGALLYLTGDRGIDLTALQLQPSNSTSFKRRCRQWLQRLAPPAMLKRHRAMAEYRRRLGTRPPYGSQEAFRDPPLADDYGMDESVDRFLARQDMHEVGEIRRRIYQIWQRWSEEQGLTPVFRELAVGAVPLVFPAFAESAAVSRQWYDWGHRTGVDIHSWPTLPKDLVKRNGGAMRLWERLVCFPIHQEMDMRVLENRLPILERTASGDSS